MSSVATHKMLERAARDAVDVLQFCKTWLGWEPHPGQVRWLTAPRRQVHVLVCGRRWGKSEMAGIQALHYAITHPGHIQGIVSVTLDQARISYDVALSMCMKEPLLTALVKSVKETPFPALRFKNDAAIIVRSAAREGIYLRGHKFHRIIVDEADYLSDKMLSEVIRPALADVGGQLVLITTPKPKPGPAYPEFKRGMEGHPGVYAQGGSTLENPHIDHDYVMSLRDKLTATAWAREIEGRYVEDEESVFDWGYIVAAYEDSKWTLPVEPNGERCYVQGVDLAKHTDWTVHAVLDATERPYKLVAWERYQRSPWPVVARKIRELHERYRCQKTLIDASGVGDAVLDEVSDIAKGFVFTARSKLDLLTNLQVALERGDVRFPFIRELVDELQEYKWEDKGLTTDCVMALALAVWAGRPRYEVEYVPKPWW